MAKPPSQTYVNINKYWDRVSKIIICLVDAGLNWYFIHVRTFTVIRSSHTMLIIPFLQVVDARLVKQHGLRKYKPLIGYYTRLGILSICMDVMLLGLMALPNQVVYIQFHPVAYVSLSPQFVLFLSTTLTMMKDGQTIYRNEHGRFDR
jgi:hypothetical protein